MSGDNQHFIPQFFLKGFRDRTVSGGKKAWVYRQEAEPQLKFISEIAADNRFYSPPDPGSLDEAITDYENRLATYFQKLRKQPLGSLTDPSVPGEIIAHLTARTESMRTGFGYGAKQMAVSTLKTLTNEDTLRKLLGLDGDAPDERFKGLMADMLKEHAPAIKAAGLSDEAAQRLVFVMAKEKFSEIFQNAKPMAQAVTAKLYNDADKIVAGAQRKALEKAVVPEARAKSLQSLNWEIVPTQSDAILPDCVAIAFGSDGKPKPLLLADADEMVTAILPMDTRRLLVGRKDASVEINPFLFNIHAVSCSESFFVASGREAPLEEWAKYIGVVSKTTIHEKLVDVFSEYQVSIPAPKEISQEPVAISMIFSGSLDEETAFRVRDKLQGALNWAAKTISFDRIDQITFTSDVAKTVANIDRGFAASTAPPEGQVIYAKTITLLRDNQLHAHIVLDERIGMALLLEAEQPEWVNAVYHVMKEMAEANATIEFDKAFPGTMLRPHSSLFNALRYEQVAAAWTGYISSRFSGKFWPSAVQDRNAMLSDAIAALKKTLPVLGARFRANSDHGVLLRDTLPHIEAILRHSACLAGVMDALELDILEDEEMMQVFRSINLAEWFVSFVADLRLIWDRRRQWASSKEFIGLSRHTERVLWQCGMILIEMPSGECRLEFPNIGAPQPRRREACKPNDC